MKGEDERDWGLLPSARVLWFRESKQAQPELGQVPTSASRRTRGPHGRGSSIRSAANL